MYSIRTTFNKVEEGQFFTFRKNGDIMSDKNIENECYKVDEYWEDTNGVIHKINVRDLSGGASYVKSKRCIVWVEK